MTGASDELLYQILAPDSQPFEPFVQRFRVFLINHRSLQFVMNPCVRIPAGEPRPGPTISIREEGRSN